MTRMLDRFRKYCAAAAAVSLVAGTAAGAVPPAEPIETPVAAAPAPMPNPWLTLSALSGADSTGTAVAAAQEESQFAASGWPPTLPLLGLLADIAAAVYILLDDDSDSPLEPVSPD
jgi:hypothetical protein